MTVPNPYAAPEAPVRGITSESFDIPEEITKHIRYGWIAALVSGTLTLLLIVVAMLGDSGNAAIQLWSLGDVVLIFGLAFGIYRKSRVAATVMFAYFLLSKILIMVETGMPTGVVLGLVFLIFYFRAMVGTFRYHRFVKHAKRFPPPPKRRLSEDPFFQTKPPASDSIL